MPEYIPVPQYKLNNGITIPLVGYGTFAKGRTSGLTYNAVTAALDAGYRHLDCAWFYKNEDEVGQALRDWLARNPSAKRADIFITTKVWLHLCGSEEDVAWSLNDSLRMLGLDYVDCFLIHWPIVAERDENHQPKVGEDGKYIINQTLTQHPEKIYAWAENLQRAGKTRSIGISNWTIPLINQLLQTATIKPVMNQIEIHPYLPNDELVSFCMKNDILPVAYSPLGSQHVIPGTDGQRLSSEPALVALAEKKRVSVGQVLIGWGLKRGYGVVPMSKSPERIGANLQVVNMDDEDMKAVEDAARGKTCRFCNLEYIFGYDLWGTRSS